VGMSFRTGLVVVMAAERLVDLAKRVRPFGLGLPIPVKREALTAYTATSSHFLVTALAKDLHRPPPLLPSPVGFPAHDENSTAVQVPPNIPNTGIPAVIRGMARSHSGVTKH